MRYYRVEDVSSILGVSNSKAYKIIQQLNAELKQKDKITIAGRCPARYFDQRFSI